VTPPPVAGLFLRFRRALRDPRVLDKHVEHVAYLNKPIDHERLLEVVATGSQKRRPEPLLRVTAGRAQPTCK
jgi:hypothetical protein